jgi:hypothetical protein
MKKILFICFISMLTFIITSCGVYKEPCEGVTAKEVNEEYS